MKIAYKYNFQTKLGRHNLGLLELYFRPNNKQSTQSRLFGVAPGKWRRHQPQLLKQTSPMSHGH